MGEFDFQGLNQAAVSLAMQELREIGLSIRHRMELCRCFWYINPSLSRCEVGQKGFEARREAKRFAEWDALGLGYIGPKL